MSRETIIDKLAHEAKRPGIYRAYLERLSDTALAKLLAERHETQNRQGHNCPNIRQRLRMMGGATRA